jgi:hypothetical protein
MKTSQYPFSTEKIQYRDAVEFIAATIFPSKKPSSARKKVRDRLYRYRVAGKIPSGGIVSAEKFFRAVLEQIADWNRLRLVTGLPGLEGSFSHLLTKERASARDSVEAEVIPGDIGSAQRLIQELQYENRILKVRVDALETKVSELEPFMKRNIETAKKISNSTRGKPRRRD